MDGINVTYCDAMLQQQETLVWDGDETVEEMLDAALEQFQHFGLSRTTMDDVARRAGVSRVTIYRRFGSRDRLVDAVILREERRFFDLLENALESANSTEEWIAEGFALTLGFLREHQLLNRLLSTEPEVLLPHLTVDAESILAAARAFVSERLRKDVKKGRLPAHDAEVAGEMLARLALSFLLTPGTVARLKTTADARRFARRYLIPALDGAPGRSRS